MGQVLVLKLISPEFDKRFKYSENHMISSYNLTKHKENSDFNLKTIKYIFNLPLP